MEKTPVLLHFQSNRLRIPPLSIGCFYSVFFGGYYDPLIDRLRPTDVVVDGGANIGAFTTLIASRVRRVYAIEPHPENFAFLCENIRRNRLDNVIPVQAALADKDGVAFFEGRGEEGHLAAQGTMVRTIALDSIGEDDISAIKLDIEGAEIIALRGQRALSGVHSIAFELDENALARFRYHPEYATFPRHTYTALIEDLKAQGFRISDYGNSRIGIIPKLASWDLVRSEVRTSLFGTRYGLSQLVKSGGNVLKPHSANNLAMIYAFR